MRSKPGGPKRFYRLEHRASTGSSDRALEFGIFFTPLMEKLVGNTSAATCQREVSGIALPKMEASGVSDAGNVERAVNPAAPIQLTPSHTEDPGEAAPSMGHALIGRRKYHLVPWSKNSISQTLGPVRWSSSKQRQDSSP
jgi:hypothetical protein